MKLKSFVNRILLLLLLAFFIFVFYLGMEKIELEENQYGIVFTKTSGWSDRIVDKEGFSWSYEKVIPENYNIHKFRIEKSYLELKGNGTLPSGKLYADFSGISDSNFNYSYAISTFFKFNKDYLRDYVIKGYFTEESYSAWIENSKTSISNYINGYINKRVNDGNYFTFKADITQDLRSSYPHFHFEELSVNITSPDLNLYKTSREYYINHIEEKIAAEKEFLGESLKQQTNQKVKLELLKMYGEVFTQYPIMIEYIKADQNMILDRAKLEDFIPHQSQN